MKPTIYPYQEKADANKTVTVKGTKIRCYSKEKLTKTFPRGGYSFVGEIYEDNADAKAGILKINESELPISPCRDGNGRAMTDVGFIPVGNNRFIAVMKKTGLTAPVWLVIVFLAVAAAVTATLLLSSVFHKDTENPTGTDPYIKPIQTELLTISGTLTFQTAPVENAHLSLCQGQTEIAVTDTDENGQYLFAKISNGIYSLKASYGKASEICAVTVDNRSVVMDFDLTESALSVNVQMADENTPAVAVNGLNDAAKDHTAEGKFVDVTLVATKLNTEDVPAADTALITQKSGETVLTYFDFSIFCEVYSLAGVKESKDGIFETEEPLEIIIPYDSSRDVGTYVFRTHGGESVKFTQLCDRPADHYQDGTCYFTKDHVFVYTKYFSTYAIGSASGGNVTKGSDTVTYSNKAYIDLSEKKIEMLYMHDHDSTNDVRLELYLVGENENLLISTSDIIPAGYKLETMILKDDLKASPSVGTYEGLLKILYLDTQGNTTVNVDLPLSVAVTK